MKIVVLAGGISTERDVSLSSGRGIYQALKTKGHQVILLDVFLGLPEPKAPWIHYLIRRLTGPHPYRMYRKMLRTWNR